MNPALTITLPADSELFDNIRQFLHDYLDTYLDTQVRWVGGEPLSILLLSGDLELLNVS